MKMIRSLLARMPLPVKLGIPLGSALLATAACSAAAAVALGAGQLGPGRGELGQRVDDRDGDHHPCSARRGRS